MPKRALGTWIKTWEGTTPTSEVEYTANIGLVDEVLVMNGGAIQPDGSIVQDPVRTDNAFAQELKSQATAHNQRYSVALHAGGGVSTTEAILGDPALRQALADNLVTLATTRFDAPWDGVNLEMGYPSVDYYDQWRELVLLLSYELRRAGVLLSFYFRYLPGLHAYEPALMRQVADWVEYSTYFGFPSQLYYVVKEQLIRYVQGYSAQDLSAALGNFSQLWRADDSKQNLNYAAAMQIVQGAGVAPEWIESYGDHLYRCKYAALPNGDRLYIYDADTMRVRLKLLDDIGIYHASLFLPGQGDPREWDVLADWKAGDL